jgi:hypothetical protein
MFPSGIFVTTELDDLLSILPDRLIQSGPPRLSVELDPEECGSDDQPALRIARWSEKWRFIEPTGPEELTSLLVESLVERDPVNELLSCRCKAEKGEYSYNFFRDGALLETFEASGPTFENVNFTSELRKVSLQELLRASDFMADSMSRFGIEPASSTLIEAGEAVIHVHFPQKKTFWQILLGAASSK